MQQAQHNGESVCFQFLADGETVSESITFAELDVAARKIAAYILSLANPGDRVLLLFPSGITFIKAFYGCMYAGVTAVPSSMPSLSQAASRITAIIDNCQPSLVLAAKDNLTRLKNKLAHSVDDKLNICAIDESLAGIDPVVYPADQPVFLQYTSGSTATPRGVRVLMSGLLQNCQMIEKSLGFKAESRLVSWLPIFHDMGLITAILLPVTVGCCAYLMPPAAFIQKPIRWLRAIDHFQADIAGGPNFAYQLCVDKLSVDDLAGLDLSCWKTAFNGSEPIRAKTLADFAQHLKPYGFAEQASFPSYGLAETVLFVSGKHFSPEQLITVDVDKLNQGQIVESDNQVSQSVTLVASGATHFGDQTVHIVDAKTGQLCEENTLGEVWIAGSHVADGYWGAPVSHRDTFRGQLNEPDEKNYLKTGDLGFLRGDLLYICGRSKDLIILRGTNYYPQDLEYAVENSDEQLRKPGFVAAFNAGIVNEEKLVIVIEVERTAMRHFDTTVAGDHAAEAMAEHCGVVADEIVFIRYNSIPRTTSGKIQRKKTRLMYEQGQFNLCGHWYKRRESNSEMTASQQDKYEAFIFHWLEERLGKNAQKIDRTHNLSAYGVDSIMAVELSLYLGQQLDREIEVELIYDNPTIIALCEALSKHVPVHAALPVKPTKIESQEEIVLPVFKGESAEAVKPVLLNTQANSFVLADFTPWRSDKLYPQQDTLDYTAWLVTATQCYRDQITDPVAAESCYQHNRDLVYRYGLSPDAIGYRQMNIFPDSIHAGTNGIPLLPLCFDSLEQDYRGKSLEQRMLNYGEFTLQIIKDWYRNEVEAPADIVHVSCSGYLSPSSPQRYIASRNWCQTRVTHSYHMGCYGAFPGLRIAAGLRSASQSLMKSYGRVDVLHTEFLSTHLDVSKNDAGHLIDMTLFADGFIRYSLYDEQDFTTQNRPGLKLVATHEVIIPDSAEEMTWTPAAYQFGMYLSKTVPLFIRDAIYDFVMQLCQNAGIDYEQQKSKLIFAVHPGGPKILDHIRDTLAIRDDQIDYGRRVLKRFGNMSSATVPHIWKDILEDSAIPAGSLVVSMAFGPGLTATGVVLEKI